MPRATIWVFGCLVRRGPLGPLKGRELTLDESEHADSRGMGRFIYTGDTGVRWAPVRLGLRFGRHPALGFDPHDMNERYGTDDENLHHFPAGKALEMRYVNVVNLKTGLRRRLPVGKLSAPILTGPGRARTLDLYEPSEGRTLTFTVTSYIGEKRRA